MTEPISTTSTASFATELAELLIKNETNQEDADRLSRDAARDQFLADAQKQVDALHAAADAAERGALFGAAFTVAGSACSFAAADYEFTASTSSNPTVRASDTLSANDWQNIGKTFTALSSTATEFTGGRESDDDKADAKHYETLAAEAKWQADDASGEIDKANRRGDKILDIVQSLNQDQNSATNAVIGRI